MQGGKFQLFGGVLHCEPVNLCRTEQMDGKAHRKRRGNLLDFVKFPWVALANAVSSLFPRLFSEASHFIHFVEPQSIPTQTCHGIESAGISVSVPATAVHLFMFLRQTDWELAWAVFFQHEILSLLYVQQSATVPVSYSTSCVCNWGKRLNQLELLLSAQPGI